MRAAAFILTLLAGVWLLTRIGDDRAPLAITPAALPCAKLLVPHPCATVKCGSPQSRIA